VTAQEGPADRVQFWARWGEGLVPPVVMASVEGWDDHQSKVARRLARTPRAPRAWRPPPLPELDPDSEAALTAQAEERLPLFVVAAGVQFSPPTVLLRDHSGAPLADDIDVGVRGEVFSATGWVPADLAPALRSCKGVSPRLHTLRAELVEWPLRHCRVTESKLIELSIVTAPVRDDTALLIADHPGVKVWDAPGGERYTRREPGTRWRALTDAGEAQFAARELARAEALALRER